MLLHMDRLFQRNPGASEIWMYQYSCVSSSEIQRSSAYPAGCDRRGKSIRCNDPADGEGLDTGDMISKIVIPISPTETGGSLFGKLAQAGADLLIKTLPSIEQGTAEFEKQPEESPTPYAAMITKQMGLMDFRKSAEELERLVRGLNPWPSAYTFLNGKTLKVWKCKVSTEKTDAVPGTIFLTDKEGIHTACGEGVLILTEVQLEGKKRMETEAFLRGYHIENGIVFTDHKE